MTGLKFVLVILLPIVRAQVLLSPMFEENFLPEKEQDIFTTPRSHPPEDYRLNDDVIPQHYTLIVVPDLTEEATTFDATVLIQIKPTRDILSFRLNYENIEFDLIELFDAESDEQLIVFTSENAATQMLTITHSNMLLKDKIYELSIDYRATFHDDMRGLYKSYYFNPDGTKEIIGTTHFGQFARRLLPCFDEPRFKAPFQINVNRDNRHRSLSNMHILQSTTVSPGRTADRYEDTPSISPYLLAIIISPFEGQVNEETNDWGVWTRPNAGDQLEFAYEIGPLLIKHFDTWTNYPYYTFEKVKNMEMAAVPDFSAGAMENLGLLIYRETNMLYDPSNTNVRYKQRIASVISHEIAHMWFGDLVTNDWWSSTWLNEGFATYFEYNGVDAVHPEWNIMTEFVVDSLQYSMQLDALESTHALSVPEETLSTYAEIRTMFSTISYEKGGSILRMIQTLMGEDYFQAAIRAYIQEYAYKTAKPEDLLNKFDEYKPGSEPDMNIYLNEWIFEKGFPLVTVRKDGDNLKITQRRFLRDKLIHDDETRWNIPITVAQREEDFINPLNRLQIFPKTQIGEFTILLPEPNLPYYILNVQQRGYYRVNYDTQNWNAIGNALNTLGYGGIHVTNRAQIVDDLFNLARSGHHAYHFIFEILDYLKIEMEYTPWLAAFNGLSYLQQRMVNGERRVMFENHILSLIGSIYDQLGFYDKFVDNHHDQLNRMNVIGYACRYGHSNCLQNALNDFDKLVANTLVMVDVNQRPTVYCTGLRWRDSAWDFMWEKFKKENVATEQIVLLAALGCTRDAPNLRKFLDIILTDDIRPQDKSSAFSNAINGNLENVDTILDYIIENYQKWSEGMSLGSTMSTLAGRMTHQDQISKLENFVQQNEHLLPTGTVSTLNSAIQTARRNVNWDESRLVELEEFLRPNNPSTISPPPSSSSSTTQEPPTDSANSYSNSISLLPLLLFAFLQLIHRHGAHN